MNYELKFESKEGYNMGVEVMTENYKYNVIKLPELGGGKGSISVRDRLEDPEDPLTPEHLAIAEAEIHNPANMVDVTDDGDGCSDGRKCGNYINATSDEEVFRSKVFGGGLTMAMAGIVGAGLSRSGGKLKDAFADGLSLLSRKQINFGAHTSDHCAEGKCDCGAIDNAYPIWQTSLELAEQQRAIGATCKLAGDKCEELIPTVSTVSGNIGIAFPGFDKESYSGRKVIDGVIESGKIVANLIGDHREVAIFINADIEDKTFDQSKPREATNGIADVFPVDVPRMRFLADKLFDTPEEKQKALISMFIYSFATSTILTKNDLPIYVISKNKNPVIDFSFN